MTNKAWIAALVLALPVAGCHWFDRKAETERDAKPEAKRAGAVPWSRVFTATPHCKTSDPVCRITVHVGPRCSIHMSEEVYIVAPHPGGVEMVWTIQGDAEFVPGKGIDFKTPGFKPLKEPYYGVELSNPEPVFTPSKTKAMSAKEWHRFNQGKKGIYYYTVNVTQGGKPCPEYDPGVVDQ